MASVNKVRSTHKENLEDIIKEIGDITSDINSKRITGRFLQESLLFNNADVIETLLILNAVNLKWMEQCCSSCKWLWYLEWQCKSSSTDLNKYLKLRDWRTWSLKQSLLRTCFLQISWAWSGFLLVSCCHR